MFWPFDFRGKGHLLFCFILSKTVVPIFSLIYKISNIAQNYWGFRQHCHFFWSCGCAPTVTEVRQNYSGGKLLPAFICNILLSYRFGHGAFLLNLEVLYKVLDIYNIIYKLNSVPQLFNKWNSWATSNGLYLAFSMYSKNKFKQIEEKTNAMHPYLFL